MHAIFDQYPMMLPYLGKNYEVGGPRSLLLIGESHYLPKDSAGLYQKAEDWYRSDSSHLNPEEVSWVNTRNIIKCSRAEGFRNRAHSIYRKSFFEINQSGPKFPDYLHVADIVVFYNYFIRPAKKGISLTVTDQDEQVAEEVFRLVFDKYRPGAVVFLSKLAFQSWKPRFGHLISVPVASIPHPGCAHWNRVNRAYGAKSGREVLGEFIRNVWAPPSLECVN